MSANVLKRIWMGITYASQQCLAMRKKSWQKAKHRLRLEKVS